jgi:uroporphyrinogen-III synthase
MSESVFVVREFDRFSEILAAAGFDVVNFPPIRILPVEDAAALDEKFENLENYDGLFLTSPHAAEVFLSHRRQQKNVYGGKIYVLGRRARTLFEKAGVATIFREAANTAEDLLDSLGAEELAGKKFLYLRGSKSLRAIPERLGQIAEIDELIVYRTVENRPAEKTLVKIAESFRTGKIGWICFFSPSGVESFAKTFGEIEEKVPKIAVIGATTAKRAVAEKLKVDFIAPQANAESFARGLIEHIKNIE